MGNVYSLFFPPPPPLTEANLPSQAGKVFIVTGGNTGIGYELCSILYRAGGTVYLAGRSEISASRAIRQIQSVPAATPGKLIFSHIALDNLASVKSFVERFLGQESRLDVLFNNAGVSHPPADSVSPQGHEVQLATNALGPYLLTRLLSPLLIKTSHDAAPASVRVVFTTSIATEMSAPKGGLDLSLLTQPSPNQQTNYAVSKTANYFFATHFASELGPRGVLSVAQNPGNIKTSLMRHMSLFFQLLVMPLLYQAKFGAYTALWAGLSSDLVIGDGGAWIRPFGSLHPNLRPDLIAATKSKEEGGTGLAAEVIAFCDRATAEFQ